MLAIAKARARVTATGTYTPAKTKRAEREIKWALLADHAPKFSGPLLLQVFFYLPRPKSAPKNRKYPTVKPDADNYLKTVMDACCGVLYDDDAQVVSIAAHKRYSDNPEISIFIEAI